MYLGIESRRRFPVSGLFRDGGFLLVKSSFFFGAIGLVIGSPMIARAEQLPGQLGSRLDAEVSRCGFQLFASGAQQRLTTDDEFAKKMAKNLRWRAVGYHAASSAAYGGALTAALSSAYAPNAGLHYLSVSAGAGLVSSGALASSKGQIAEQSPWTYDRNAVEADATKAAARLGATIGLDPVREDALRSAIVKTVVARFKEKDNSPIDTFAILKAAKYRGKDLLAPNEAKALDDVGARIASVEAPPLQSEAEKIRFLSACSATLTEQLGSLNEREGGPAKRAIGSAQVVLDDVTVFAKQHPEHKGLLPAPAGAPAQENGPETTLDSAQ